MIERSGMARAIQNALREEMIRDETVFIMGEDVEDFGGPFQVTKGLKDEFGSERVRNTPISESAIIGAAVGASMTGMRPIPEVQYSDFLCCGMDQIVNQAAKMRLMSGGQVSVPLVIRAPLAAKNRGAQHAQCLEAWFMHTPGIKVVVPSTPYDAKGLMKTAIRDDNPVIFFEHVALYGSKSPGGKAGQAKSETPALPPYLDEEYTIPFGKADIKRQGHSLTIVATMEMVHKSLDAAETVMDEGISVEVIDPRTLVPLDKETIINSVKKTNRAIVVTEETRTCSTGAEIAAMISEEAFDYLDAPVLRVCSKDVPMPFAPVAENYVRVDESHILEAIRQLI